MDQYILILTLIGIAIFSMVWMPKISEFTGVSYSIFFVFLGFLLYLLIPDYLPNPLPQKNESITLHLTELIVIISIMGTGIKIDRPFSVKAWASPLKLIAVTMILCIITATLLGYYYLGLGLASATLLGAVLAPTDPVLASDVQVDPPNEEGRSETKFALTSEAGINDGVAFPFTWLAICIGFSLSGKEVSFLEWFTYDLLYRIFSGLIVGYIIGKSIGYLIFKIAAKYKILKTRDGLLAIAATLVVYGLTELIHGYGFIAVFVCAITLRHYEKGNHYHDELHSFTDQIERSLLCILLIIFGGSLAMGVLEKLTWEMVLFSLSFLLIVRPLFGWLALSNSKIDLREKLAIGFFGIRGMGSVFYLAFAFSKFNFEYQDELWAIVIFTILVSIIIHGFTANPVMKKIADLDFKNSKQHV